MPVRAKFNVRKVEKDDEGGGTVHMDPVYSGSKENDQFYKYTPSGSIELTTVNADALAQFKEGDEFYVDFTKCEKN